MEEKTYLDFNMTDKCVFAEQKARQTAFLITSEKLSRQNIARRRHHWQVADS